MILGVSACIYILLVHSSSHTHHIPPPQDDLLMEVINRYPQEPDSNGPPAATWVEAEDTFHTSSGGPRGRYQCQYRWFSSLQHHKDECRLGAWAADEVCIHLHL